MGFDFLCLTDRGVFLRWAALTCLFAFVFHPQCLFSQTTETLPEVVDGTGKPNVKIQRLPDGGYLLIEPRAEHPFESLTIIVGEGQQLLADNLSKYIPSACQDNTDHLPFVLRADGTMYPDRFPLLDQIASPESVVKSIESAATLKNNCFLTLRVDREVDFNTVAQTIKALQGIEKRFERFQLIYGFSKVEREKDRLRDFRILAMVFHKSHQRFPKSLNELREMFPNMASLADQWGNKVSYIVTHKGTGCRFTWAGKDGKFDTDDDLIQRVEEEDMISKKSTERQENATGQFIFGRE